MTEAQKLLNIFNTPESPKAPEVRSINKVNYCNICSTNLETGQKEIGYCVRCDSIMSDK